MMVEEMNQLNNGNKKLFKNSNNFNHSILYNSYPSYSQAISSPKIQDYFPFRSAENHPNNLYSFNKNNQTNSMISNSNHLYKQNINNEQNFQEYRRYRNATQVSRTLSSPNGHHLIFPCYSKLTTQNEYQYSRYRDSRSTKKKTICTYDNLYSQPHQRCRSFNYDNQTQRFPVPDNKVSWNITYPDYEPIEYTTDRVKKNPRADPSDPSKIDTFNKLDEKIDRRSFTGEYYVDSITNRPRNPMGRTGISGRGRLYYWGPNHAGDPIVTRWARDKNGSIVYRRVNAHDQPKPVLEFVAIQRRDTKQWAIPGGMVDPNEHVSETVKREFQEEAVRDGVDKNIIEKLLSNGEKLCEMYVDDPRNTDNAWIETVAVHFHDATGELTKQLNLNPGSDAEKVVWRQIDRNLELYACHKDFLKAVVDRLGAYW